jgi:hypothetical protein
MLGQLTCFRSTPDAGQLCRSGSDCAGLCLAVPGRATGQCSAEDPIFGCFELLGEAGERMGLCID